MSDLVRFDVRFHTVLVRSSPSYMSDLVRCPFRDTDVIGCGADRIIGSAASYQLAGLPWPARSTVIVYAALTRGGHDRKGNTWRKQNRGNALNTIR
jgi:hypothetical protein